MIAIAVRMDEPTSATGEITKRLYQRLMHRLRKRSYEIVVREIRNAGLVVTRNFLKGFVPGGEVVNFGVDFLLSEVARELTPTKIAEKYHRIRGFDDVIDGFSDELSQIRLLEGTRLKRGVKALADRVLTRVRQRYGEQAVEALRPALGDWAAEAIGSQAQELLRVRELVKLAEIDYRDIAARIANYEEEVATLVRRARPTRQARDKLIADITRDFGPDAATKLKQEIARVGGWDNLAKLNDESFGQIAVQVNRKRTAELADRLKQFTEDRKQRELFIQKSVAKAKRAAADKFLAEVRRTGGLALADQLESRLGLSRKEARGVAYEVLTGVRRTNIEAIADIVREEVNKAKVFMERDLQTVAEQVNDHVGTNPFPKQPGESIVLYEERQRAVQRTLRRLNAAESARQVQVEDLGPVGNINELPPWRESWDFPEPRQPLSDRPATNVISSQGELIVTPAPRVPGELPSRTLKKVVDMSRAELEAELKWLSAQGVKVPRGYLSRNKLQDAVNRLRYGVYPGKMPQWPSAALPDPRSLNNSQLIEQLNELYDGGFSQYFPQGSWWQDEDVMRKTLTRIRNQQFRLRPTLKPRPEVNVLPGSGQVIQLPDPPRFLPEEAGWPGPVRSIPDVETLSYQDMQKIVGQMNKAGYEVPKKRTKKTLQDFLEKARREGAVLPGDPPPHYPVRTYGPDRGIPFEQRWEKLINETNAEYLARLRGLVARKTGEIPMRAELEGDRAFTNRLARQYQGMQQSLSTPMEGWRPIPDDPYTPVPKENRWKRLAGEGIDDYMERLQKLHLDRAGHRLEQLPEESLDQFSTRLKSKVKLLQETPPRGLEFESVPSKPITGSRRRYQYDPVSKLYLDTRTGKLRERFIWDAASGRFRDLSTGRYISTRKIRSMLRQSQEQTEEIIANLQRALLESDAADITTRATRREVQRQLTSNIARLEDLPRYRYPDAQGTFKALPARVEAFTNITTQDWKRILKRELRLHYGNQFVLGAGGLDNLENIVETTALARSISREQAESLVFQELNEMRDRQFALVDKFADGLIDGIFTVGQIMLRSRLYIGMGKAAYGFGQRLFQRMRGNDQERRVLGMAEHCADCVAYAAMGWQPIGTFPPPGEKSACGMNCYCTMEYRNSANADSADSSWGFDVTRGFAIRRHSSASQDKSPELVATP